MNTEMLIQPGDKLKDVPQKVFDQIRIGIRQPDHPFRYTVLSSVDENQPQSRYVVMRDISNDFVLSMYTDYRSSKVHQLIQNQKASLLFYHEELLVQVRVDGNVSVHHEDDISRQYWKTVSDHHGKAYRSLLQPGEKIAAIQDAHEWTDEHHFCVIRFKAGKLDVLQLNGTEHLRAIFTMKDNAWHGSWIAP